MVKETDRKAYSRKRARMTEKVIAPEYRLGGIKMKLRKNGIEYTRREHDYYVAPEDIEKANNLFKEKWGRR